jgi:hypothetical protein
VYVHVLWMCVYAWEWWKSQQFLFLSHSFPCMWFFVQREIIQCKHTTQCKYAWKSSKEKVEEEQEKKVESITASKEDGKIFIIHDPLIFPFILLFLPCINVMYALVAIFYGWNSATLCISSSCVCVCVHFLSLSLSRFLKNKFMKLLVRRSRWKWVECAWR